jgi:hypothetical protein
VAVGADWRSDTGHSTTSLIDFTGCADWTTEYSGIFRKLWYFATKIILAYFEKKLLQ